MNHHTHPLEHSAPESAYPLPRSAFIIGAVILACAAVGATAAVVMLLNLKAALPGVAAATTLAQATPLPPAGYNGGTGLGLPPPSSVLAEQFGGKPRELPESATDDETAPTF